MQFKVEIHRFLLKAAYLDDGLSKEIIRFTSELLPHFRLKVIIFIPDSNFDPIRRIVTFAISRLSKMFIFIFK